MSDIFVLCNFFKDIYIFKYILYQIYCIFFIDMAKLIFFMKFKDIACIILFI